MPKKKTSNVNVTAFDILRAVTGEPAETISLEGKSAKNKDLPKKNLAAVALGRLGGLKGGKARAKKLSARQKSIIARRAAKARWAK